MGNPDKSKEITQTDGIPGIVEETPVAKVDDGVTTKQMAQIAQQNILNSEGAMQPIRLPGNRRERRKLMKAVKIPKQLLHVGSKEEADAYTSRIHAKDNIIQRTFGVKVEKKVEETKKI